MNNIKKRILIISICALVLCLIIYAFFRIMNLQRINNLFSQNASKMQEELENPIFRLEKVIVYSDANIEDKSQKKNLEDINVSQFTDFAVYINNQSTTSELTAENTVNKIYIDNISVSETTLGNQKVYYKNIENLCNYVRVENGASQIDYEVIHENNEKTKVKVPNTFFTDCSEPLVLTYVNENLVKNEDVSNNNSKLALDGSILKHLGIKLDDLNYKISFRINIENNQGELFYCDFSSEINLDSDEGGIYTGYIMEIFDLTDSKYIFKKA